MSLEFYFFNTIVLLSFTFTSCSVMFIQNSHALSSSSSKIKRRYNLSSRSLCFYKCEGFLFPRNIIFDWLSKIKISLCASHCIERVHDNAFTFLLVPVTVAVTLCFLYINEIIFFIISPIKNIQRRHTMMQIKAH